MSFKLKGIDFYGMYVGSRLVAKLMLNGMQIWPTGTVQPIVPSLKLSPFPIGMAVDQGKMFIDGYLETLLDVGSITPENGMNPGHLCPSLVSGALKYIPWTNNLRYDFVEADQLCTLAEQKGIRVHGAHLSWHTDNANAQKIVIDYPGQEKAMLTEYLKESIGNIVTHFKVKFPGTVTGWNVINEAIYAAGYKNSDGTNIASGSAKKSTWGTWFTLDEFFEITCTAARTADPDCKLFYNDYDLETSNTGQSDSLELRIDNLKAKNIFVPNGRGGQIQVQIDGVGFQFHSLLSRLEGSAGSSTNKTSIWVVRDRFKRWANKGLLVHISEVDVLTQEAGKIYDPVMEERVAKWWESLVKHYIECVPKALRWGITSWAPTDRTNFINTKSGVPHGAPDSVDPTQRIIQFPSLYDYWSQPKLAYHRFVAALMKIVN